MSTPAPGAVLVMGAGSIGCYVGGQLAAAGAAVVLVGRPRVISAVRRLGLTISDLDGDRRHVAAADLALHEAVPRCAPTLVLLCVKSGATAEAARELAAALPAATPVVSLQNGIGNADTARDNARALDVLPAIVGFNVAEVEPAHYHRGTSGEIIALDHPALRRAAPVFAAAGLPLQLRAEMRPVQWGKLLMNLNNPVNALSGLPLREQLLDRSLRKVTAALQQEALAAMAAAGIRPAQLTPLPPQRIPWLLRLPTPIFRLLALRMLRIDPRARSSMADDLAYGRTTEVDALCGEVVRLAATLEASAPLNARIAQLVEAWPHERKWRSGPALLAALGLD